MRKFLTVTLLSFGLLVMALSSYAQSFPGQHDSLTRMIRISEDDDFMDFSRFGTDDSYTNGTRIDYFYMPAKRPHFFVDRWMPGAGDSSINIYGWGLMQLMYTPDNIDSTGYQPGDYPWSGALVATHTRYSYNPVKHYDLQTELVLGVIGPAALDKQTQTIAHAIIDYDRPKGWSHQFRNDLLVNVNFAAEKELVSCGSWLSVIGGAQVSGGTMQNSAGLYPLILIGKKDNYFNGFFSQHASAGQDNGHKHWQAYFYAKPEMQLFLTNALLQGGMFTTNPNLQLDKDSSRPYPPLQHWIGSFSYGAIASIGRLGISFSQVIMPATLKGLYCHNYGNISLYYGW